jgi:hypothetical protein
MSEPARAPHDLSSSVFRRLGISGSLDPTRPLVLEAFPEICWRGVIRPSAANGNSFGDAVLGYPSFVSVTFVGCRVPHRARDLPVLILMSGEESGTLP